MPISRRHPAACAPVKCIRTRSTRTVDVDAVHAKSLREKRIAKLNIFWEHEALLCVYALSLCVSGICYMFHFPSSGRAVFDVETAD
ncbi:MULTISPECIES: hypothetical protein [Ralstonia solanacearum species complex]|uniref:hypothetical protein n=1 Tax=Ralstonia solanacearum species complex TaxID=3116862 RepID=UPI0011127536|nr:hypothetical protein [Ralstonia solanacearum]MDC6176329.1 hypothetical protein [Ralstonia solanacearum]MDC6209452.1 hypothetical protein [Ralstonia solanacearum]MDC6237579.1 hypothetical protein [Ralstonia solanacearum]MDD7799858.1 hypothetical protein [Ralstonia solanacearum]MDN4063591.1 hypothetical protein [Ralstonia solanacearum]